MNRPVDIPPLDPSFIRSTQFPNPSDNGGVDSGKRAVVTPSYRSSLPPLSPHSQIPTTRQPIGSQNFSPGSSLSRSMFQPSTAFSLPPLSPSPSSFRDSPSAPVANNDVALPPIPFRRSNSARVSGSTLPSIKAQRHSNSDIISGLNSLMAQNSQKFIYPKPIEMPVGVTYEKEGVGERKSHGEAMDELFSAYMNLDENEMARNSSDLDGESGNKIVSKSTAGVKRRASKDIVPSSRHCRSLSMDTLNVKSSTDEESTKLPPSPGNLQGTNSVDGNENEFGDGRFTMPERKKIVDSNKLRELAASNPKKVKRILANRRSAALSQMKKAQHLSELEQKVQTLRTERTTLTAQFTSLERDKMVLENENKELRLRIQAKEETAQLHKTLIEQLTGQAQWLRAVRGEPEPQLI